jgi:hypothetical protein
MYVTYIRVVVLGLSLHYEACHTRCASACRSTHVCVQCEGVHVHVRLCMRAYVCGCVHGCECGSYVNVSEGAWSLCNQVAAIISSFAYSGWFLFGGFVIPRPVRPLSSMAGQGAISGCQLPSNLLSVHAPGWYFDSLHVRISILPHL